MAVSLVEAQEPNGESAVSEAFALIAIPEVERKRSRQILLPRLGKGCH